MKQSTIAYLWLVHKKKFGGYDQHYPKVAVFVFLYYFIPQSFPCDRCLSHTSIVHFLILIFLPLPTHGFYCLFRIQNLHHQIHSHPPSSPPPHHYHCHHHSHPVPPRPHSPPFEQSQPSTLISPQYHQSP